MYGRKFHNVLRTHHVRSTSNPLERINILYLGLICETTATLDMQFSIRKMLRKSITLTICFKIFKYKATTSGAKKQSTPARSKDSARQLRNRRQWFV